MDSVDMKLLKMLGENARTPLKKLGREVGLSTSGVRRRIKQLERGGVIRGYTAIVNPGASGWGISAFLSVRTNSHDASKVARALARYREVCEVHGTTGDHGLILKVRARDLDNLNKFVEEKLNSYDGIDSVITTVTMKTFKETQLSF